MTNSTSPRSAGGATEEKEAKPYRRGIIGRWADYCGRWPIWGWFFFALPVVTLEIIAWAIYFWWAYT